MVHKTLMALLLVSLVAGIEGCGKDDKDNSGGGGNGSKATTQPAPTGGQTDPTTTNPTTPTPPDPAVIPPPTPAKGDNPPGTDPGKPAKPAEPVKPPVAVDPPKPTTPVEPTKPPADGTVTEAQAEAAAKELLGGFAQLVDTIKTIKDVPSAQAAGPKLEEISKNLEAAVAKVDKMKKGLPKATLDKLEAKYEPIYQKHVEALKGELARLKQLNIPDVTAMANEMEKELADE